MLKTSFLPANYRRGAYEKGIQPSEIASGVRAWMHARTNQTQLPQQIIYLFIFNACSQLGSIFFNVLFRFNIIYFFIIIYYYPS